MLGIGVGELVEQEEKMENLFREREG